MQYSYAEVMTIPHTRTVLDFVTISKGMKGEQKLLIGIWLFNTKCIMDDFGYAIPITDYLVGYYPLNRDDSLANLEWHLIQRTFDYELSTHGYCKFVNRPVLEKMNAS